MPSLRPQTLNASLSRQLLLPHEDEDPDEKEGEAGAWWDAERYVAKAERDFSRAQKNFEESLGRLDSDMQAAVSDCQNSTDACMCVNELKLVVNRNNALKLVMGSDPTALQTYIDSFTNVDCVAPLGMGSDAASSKDLSILTRVGPCSNYGDLKLISLVRAASIKFKNVTTEADLQASCGNVTLVSLDRLSVL